LQFRQTLLPRPELPQIVQIEGSAPHRSDFTGSLNCESVDNVVYMLYRSILTDSSVPMKAKKRSKNPLSAQAKQGVILDLVEI
jgi:hypothetical protein